MGKGGRETQIGEGEGAYPSGAETLLFRGSTGRGSWGRVKSCELLRGLNSPTALDQRLRRVASSHSGWPWRMRGGGRLRRGERELCSGRGSLHPRVSVDGYCKVWKPMDLPNRRNLRTGLAKNLRPALGDSSLPGDPGSEAVTKLESRHHVTIQMRGFLFLSREREGKNQQALLILGGEVLGPFYSCCCCSGTTIGDNAFWRRKKHTELEAEVLHLRKMNKLRRRGRVSTDTPDRWTAPNQSPRGPVVPVPPFDR